MTSGMVLSPNSNHYNANSPYEAESTMGLKSPNSASNISKRVLSD